MLIHSSVIVALLLLSNDVEARKGDGNCRGGGRGGKHGHGDRDRFGEEDLRGRRNESTIVEQDDERLGMPLIEQVKQLLDCLEHKSESECKSVINKTASCLECEETAMRERIEEANAERYPGGKKEEEEKNGRYPGGKKGRYPGEGVSTCVLLGVSAGTAMLFGLLGFMLGRRNSGARPANAVAAAEQAAALPPFASITKVATDAWTKGCPAAAVPVIEGSAVVEQTPVEKMTA